MKIGLGVGTHGDEDFPLEIAHSLELDPISGVVPFTINPRAVALGRRGVDTNMARAYPGRANSLIYEERRAAKVVAWCEEENFDVILDMHTNPYEGNDAAYAFAHGRYLVTSQDALVVAGLLQFKRIIVARNANLGWALNKAITIDISPDSPFRSVKHWRQELGWLATLDMDRDYGVDVFTPSVEFYAHMATPSYEQRDALGLQRVYDGFEPLPDEAASLCSAFTTPPDLHAVTWGTNYPPYSGEIVRRYTFDTVDNPYFVGPYPSCCGYHSSSDRVGHLEEGWRQATMSGITQPPSSTDAMVRDRKK